MKQIQDISFRERIRLNLVSSMKSAGINQVQLADRLGISKGTVNNWVRGNNSPDVDMVPRICKELGISILSLYSPLEFEHEEPAENNVIPVTKPLTPEAMRIASQYDELDDYAKETVSLLVEREIGHALKKFYTRGRHNVEAVGELIYFPLSLSIQPVSAGTGAYLGPEEMETIFVQKNDLTEQASFAVKVAGDSMEPTYSDGDILLVKGAEDIRIGEIGIFTMDGDGYVKKRGDGELISLNPEYGPIPMNESIWCNGRVIGILTPEWIADN